MRKLFLLIFLGLIILPAMSYASIYGVLRGKVVDEEGKGLRGATVFLEGTAKGTVVRENDGSFTIVNIEAAEYTLRFTFVGKQTVRQIVRISADKTSTVEVVMKDEKGGVTTETVTVTAQSMVNVDDEGGTKKIMSGAEIQNIAREGLSGVVAMTSGVLQSGGGFMIRGGRTEETQIKVDGIDVGNQFTGGFGVSGSGYYPMVSNYATEEVQVITGGFTAEYGDVSSGVVNTIVRRGRDDRYDGFIRWLTDVPALYGSQPTGLQVIREGTRLKAVEAGEGAQFQGSQQNTFEFGTGGPIPVLNDMEFFKNATFYLTGNYFHENHRDNTYKIFDPWGTNIGQRPDNQSWVRDIRGNVRFTLPNDMTIQVSGNYGISSFEFSGWGWMYANQEGHVYDKTADGSFILKTNEDGSPVTNGIPERIVRQNVLDQFVNGFNILINHTLTSKSFYELRIGNASNNDVSSRRVGWEDPGFFTGFEVWEPTDDYKVENNNLVLGQDKIIDHYTFLSNIGYTKDGFTRADIPQRNPISGYFEGNSNASGTYNPYGLVGLFPTSGGGSFSFRDGNWWTFDGSYTQIFKTGEFDHTFKTGFLLTLFELHRHSNGNPYDGNPFFDVYTDGRWGGNLYADNEVVREKTNKPYKPTKFGIYFNDQISFKGIRMSAGLRLDYFNPNSDYRLPSNSWIPISSDTGFAVTSAKIQVSPRINISYPITDMSFLRLSYGMFFQMPQLQYMYDNFAADILRGNSIIGNPNMDAQRTNQYEIAYSQQLTEVFAFTSVAYYKDIYNQLGLMRVNAVPEPYYQYTVSDYGSSRGIEFTLEKMAKDNFSFDLNYTLAWVTGTAQTASSNYNVIIDPYTDKPAFPLSEYPMGQDIRHYAKSNFRVYWRDNEGPSIGGIKLLENTNLIFTGIYRTGTPYTRTDRSGTAIAERNSERQPSRWLLDARIAKSFRMSDIFGDGAGNSEIEIFANINNILNLSQALGVYAATGDPIDDGRTFDRQVGDFANTAYYKDPDIANPATYASVQYDFYGNRRYNSVADFDGNGIVTQAETYESYFRYVATTIAFRGNFQAPRTINIGMMFRF